MDRVSEWVITDEAEFVASLALEEELIYPRRLRRVDGVGGGR